MDADKRFWQQQYDAAAQQFRDDCRAGRWVSPHFYRMARRRVEQLLAPHRGQAGRLLDVCCGNGAILETCDRWGFQVTGTDISTGALRFLRAVPSRAHLRVAAADAGVLPFADAAFEAVVSVGMLQCVSNVPGYLAELARVTRPGGVLLMLFSPDAWLVRRRYRRALPRHAELARYRLHNPAALVAALEASGFSQDDVSYLYYVFYIPPLIPLLALLNRFPALCRRAAALATSAVVVARRE